MTTARSSLVNIANTPWYHCMARCVRRAFLCGKDHLTGKNYTHRKQWVVDRLGELAQVFAIEICAYAVMSNHYHVVLHVNAQQCDKWSTKEVLRRWTILFSGSQLIKRYLTGACLDESELQRVEEYTEIVRQRLKDISWFMRCLNEYLARKANEEDRCKGRFWEGRFKSQALLDEAAILSCMAYVDLNPVRAGLESLPEDSDFTSIQARIQEWKKKEETPTVDATTEVPLKPMKEKDTTLEQAIPFSFADYMELVDWTGRAIQHNKRGAIDNDLPKILDRVAIDTHAWMDFMKPEGNCFQRVMGKLTSMQACCQAIGMKWLHGMSASRRFFGQA